ncbi:MAG: S-layer homology domain-containing protein [Leptolyngbyaceae cyanobacterium SU_3_3]|nr:S-layer homology domain-containing protein [Leptolyngbyaceae cyanobacterium SU_3_3]
MPPPPEIASTPVERRSLNLDQLPIDAIIADSVQPASKKPADAPQPTAKTVAQPTTQSAASLSDVNAHPAEEAITALVQRGVVKGFSDGTFRPDLQVTDDEFRSMMQKGLQKDPR